MAFHGSSKLALQTLSAIDERNPTDNATEHEAFVVFTRGTGWMGKLKFNPAAFWNWVESLSKSTPR